jgi:hypothetical protein
VTIKKKKTERGKSDVDFNFPRNFCNSVFPVPFSHVQA